MSESKPSLQNPSSMDQARPSVVSVPGAGVSGCQEPLQHDQLLYPTSVYRLWAESTVTAITATSDGHTADAHRRHE